MATFYNENALNGLGVPSISSFGKQPTNAATYTPVSTDTDLLNGKNIPAYSAGTGFWGSIGDFISGLGNRAGEVWDNVTNTVGSWFGNTPTNNVAPANTANANNTAATAAAAAANAANTDTGAFGWSKETWRDINTALDLGQLGWDVYSGIQQLSLAKQALAEQKLTNAYNRRLSAFNTNTQIDQANQSLRDRLYARQKYATGSTAGAEEIYKNRELQHFGG